MRPDYAETVHGEPVTVVAAGRELQITNPHKPFFSRAGLTKLDTVNHYLGCEDALMRALRDRPTMMQRHPNGASGKSFWQKRVPKHAPDWLTTTVVSTVNGTTSDSLVLADLAHVVWAVNAGVLGFHPWPYTTADESIADELRLDLDPQPGTNFDMVREAAAELKMLLDEHGLASWPKTTGSKGLHVHVRLEPRWDSYAVRAAAVTLARELEVRRPDLMTAAWWKEERGERVFLDFNQNAPHKTVFGAWSARARVGAQVSTPFFWSQLDEIDPEQMTIQAIPDWLAEHGDPWKGIEDAAQDITPLVAEWRRVIDDGGFDAPWPPVYPKMEHEPPRVAPSRAATPDS